MLHCNAKARSRDDMAGTLATEMWQYVKRFLHRNKIACLQCGNGPRKVRAWRPVLIKKYGNRRLYDTGDSRYITLDELATKVSTGVDVRVVDAQNSEDLTQATLTQVVLETGNAAKFLPVQLLTQMIRLSDDSLAEFFSRYVTSALDLYLQAKRGVQSIRSTTRSRRFRWRRRMRWHGCGWARPDGMPSVSHSRTRASRRPRGACRPPPPPPEPDREIRRVARDHPEALRDSDSARESPRCTTRRVGTASPRCDASSTSSSRRAPRARPARAPSKTRARPCSDSGGAGDVVVRRRPAPAHPRATARPSAARWWRR